MLEAFYCLICTEPIHGSKDIYTDKKTGARIDVENPNPGQRPGQIHLQTKDGQKYMFNIDNNAFYNKANPFAPLPGHIRQLISDPKFLAKLNMAKSFLVGS